MKRILVVGCSFVGLLKPQTKKLSVQYPDLQFDICGMSAAGNQAISAMVFAKLSRIRYDAVVVLWSGINRIDIPLGKNVHESLYYTQGTPCFSQVGTNYWYHSGGFGCGGVFSPTPKFLIEYFENQYKEPGREYLSDLSLQQIIGTHALIQSLSIPCYNSFIYDIHADYDLEIDKLFKHSLDYTLGQVAKNSTLHPLLSTTSLHFNNTPYEWARDSGNLGDDEFHPTPQAMYNWFSTFVVDKLIV